MKQKDLGKIPTRDFDWYRQSPGDSSQTLTQLPLAHQDN